MHTHTCMHAFIHTYMHTCMHACIQMYIYIPSPSALLQIEEFRKALEALVKAPTLNTLKRRSSNNQ